MSCDTQRSMLNVDTTKTKRGLVMKWDSAKSCGAVSCSELRVGPLIGTSTSRHQSTQQQPGASPHCAFVLCQTHADPTPSLETTSNRPYSLALDPSRTSPFSPTTQCLSEVLARSLPPRPTCPTSSSRTSLCRHQPTHARQLPRVPAATTTRTHRLWLPLSSGAFYTPASKQLD